ncbi:hypothetical protein [Kitasatospora camelliae]|uniref:Uncharacterized protein n=1 Tax=Kitasatospora camelliae TaxID=3156397 RepID=A0AAU8JTY8_9ACTN
MRSTRASAGPQLPAVGGRALALLLDAVAARVAAAGSSGAGGGAGGEVGPA